MKHYASAFRWSQCHVCGRPARRQLGKPRSTASNWWRHETCAWAMVWRADLFTDFMTIEGTSAFILSHFLHFTWEDLSSRDITLMGAATLKTCQNSWVASAQCKFFLPKTFILRLSWVSTRGCARHFSMMLLGDFTSRDCRDCEAFWGLLWLCERL